MWGGWLDFNRNRLNPSGPGNRGTWYPLPSYPLRIQKPKRSREPLCNHNNEWIVLPLTYPFDFFSCGFIFDPLQFCIRHPHKFQKEEKFSHTTNVTSYKKTQRYGSDTDCTRSGTQTLRKTTSYSSSSRPSLLSHRCIHKFSTRTALSFA